MTTGRLKLLRRGLLSLSVAGVVLILALVAEQASRFGDSDTGLKWEIEADLSLTGFEFEQIGDGGLEMRLKAAQAKLVELHRELVADDLSLTFFEQGAESIRLIADTGKVRLDTNVVTVRGIDRPATLTLAHGPVITTQALSWDPVARTVRSDGAAHIKQAKLTARGDQAVADVTNQTIRLIGNVNVSWLP